MNIKGLINVLAGLALISLGILGAIWVVRRVASIVLGVESELAIAIVAGSVGLGTAIVNHALQASRDRKAQVAEAQRESRSEIYQSFVDNYVGFIIDSSKVSDAKKVERLVADLGKRQREITNKMILWGSNRVIESHRVWWTTTKTVEEGRIENQLRMFAEFEDLLFALREDLGHDDRHLNRGDLLSLFLIDADQITGQSFPRFQNKKRRRSASNAKTRSLRNASGLAIEEVIAETVHERSTTKG